MAPDRGRAVEPAYQTISTLNNPVIDDELNGEGMENRLSEELSFLSEHGHEPQNFTLRGILVGLAVGLVICFSNMYFGLQTGWISSMSMPSSLIGFAFFKTLSKHLDIPFTPVENVLVQTVAGSMGTMPLGCGFVGVMPALNYLLKPEEGGPLFLSLWKLILWALGLCFFGVVFAVPLRRQVIIREKLKFPSGTATALMINVLHGKDEVWEPSTQHRNSTFMIGDDGDRHYSDASNSLRESTSFPHDGTTTSAPHFRASATDIEEVQGWDKGSWVQRVKLLVLSFSISGFYTLGTYFFPVLRNLPIFGLNLAQNWLWTLNPSLAYVGQGIIMGPATTIHMLIGAILGWAVLSPLAKHKGWAPGPIDDWEAGSKGWIIWVSLAIMLADSIVSLAYIAGKQVAPYVWIVLGPAYRARAGGGWRNIVNFGSSSAGYVPVDGVQDSTVLTDTLSNSRESPQSPPQPADLKSLPEIDAPPEHLVSGRVVWVGLISSILFCILCIRITFGALVPLYATVAAVLIALVLSVMGVRALGETDLNPVSGISKLAQLFFALIIPQSNKNSVLINLIAGAVSEAGALQAGDLMQDLKTGHLLGAAPKAQFWGQIIGSAVGAVVSALIYKLYTNVYPVPGDLFQVPTGYVWIFTARLVTGEGLPPMAWQWAIGTGLVFAATTCARIVGTDKKWHPLIPGGIAVAVGMFNVPSFTLARAIGGFMSWYWKSYLRNPETPLIVVASGFVLGEGVVSILNLAMSTMDVPHL
ncbi:hypothetical protein VE01_10110 [Pseudogymnoascus verrucosus]|uniref:Oligopeptide transporter n=1 Tax=Pseudogymnoascus verrucosus TaxID=342668 RepID=A0A1B8G7R1_9PEZI|nr:uncharacterized protein VE01_10110 [Pseudogymnoascus verrucosus]OBT91870.1 hypothetical protein VE01_10110 [Pseudogymnoascus verrucosus]